MRIAIYGNKYQEKFFAPLERLFGALAGRNAWVAIDRSFYDYLCCHTSVVPVVNEVIDEESNFDAAIALSIGGDGTFLRTAEKVARRGIPILGINTGHLGYLADASVENIDEVVENLFSGNYKIEERTVLHVTTDSGVVIDNPFALNEIAISRQSTALMMSMHTWVNDSELTSYKGDGLIISTPTGSTAYNLSVGGPILEPTSNNIVLSPISAHSLTMRPLVLRDDCTIRVTTNSRAQQYLVSIDGRPFTFDIGTSITVRKADFTVKVIQHTGHNFADTLRNKLMWGIDTVRSY
ncbi:MAG: NAD kinase [Muribaculaceae bacterium]|nr:NAD kinase [Muribaculaceae bacterium]